MFEWFVQDDTVVTFETEMQTQEVLLSTWFSWPFSYAASFPMLLHYYQQFTGKDN